VRGRIASILDWATVRGYRTGENPARWQGHLANLLPEKSKVRPVQHHAALPYNQVAAFLVTLRQQAGAPARALEFALLTAARASEAAGARWSDRYGAAAVDRPGEPNEVSEEHRVPLSDAAMAIMEAMAEGRQGGEFVFRGRKRGTSITIDSFWQLLRRMKHDDLTVHGFRSTFHDWCAERTNFPREVAEMALAHAVGDATERAYARGDLFQKRQQLAEAWARFCAAPESSGEVVPLHAAG
jgi:integrase